MAKKTDKAVTAKKKGENKFVGFFKKIGKFFKDVSGELKKVTWPTKKELVNYTLTVIAFVVAMAVIIYVLDFLFGGGVRLLGSL